MVKKTATKKTAAKKAAATTANGNPIQPGRVGLVVIAGHFLPPVQRQLKILAAQESSTIARLLQEALDLLFAKRGLSSVDKLIKEKTP